MIYASSISRRLRLRQHEVAVSRAFQIAKELPDDPLRQRMIEDMQVRNLSAVTQRVYVDQVALYARHLANHRPYSVLRKFVNTSYI